MHTDSCVCVICLKNPELQKGSKKAEFNLIKQHLRLISAKITVLIRYFRPIRVPIRFFGVMPQYNYLYTNCRACSKSSIRSATSSMPTDKRTKSSVMPAANLSAAPTLEWVMEAGC